MNAVQCDCGCEETAPINSVVGWLRVERFGIDVSRVGENQGPWHFADLDHLNGWVFNKRKGIA